MGNTECLHLQQYRVCWRRGAGDAAHVHLVGQRIAVLEVGVQGAAEVAAVDHLCGILYLDRHLSHGFSTARQTHGQISLVAVTRNVLYARVSVCMHLTL